MENLMNEEQVEKNDVVVNQNTNDHAYRRVGTGTGYVGISATIQLPTLANLNITSGSVIYNYIGIRREGVFDFEFGLGYETQLQPQYGLYRSIQAGSISDWDYTATRVAPGSTLRLQLTANNGTIACSLFDTSNNAIFSQSFTVPGAQAVGTNQSVRRVTSLLTPLNGSAHALNNRWTTTTVSTTTTTINATQANATAYNETSPAGQSWLTVDSINNFYNEMISADIRLPPFYSLIKAQPVAKSRLV